MPSSPAGEEADRLEAMAPVEMTPRICVNTPLEPLSRWSFSFLFLPVVVNNAISPERCKDFAPCSYFPSTPLSRDRRFGFKPPRFVSPASALTAADNIRLDKY